MIPPDVPADRPVPPVRVLVTEHGRRWTELGTALWVTIERNDGRRMSWSEVHGVFVESYPGAWAVQMFPPSNRAMTKVNRYHLWVLDHEPVGFDVGAP